MNTPALQPTDHFWTYLFVGIVVMTLVVIMVGVYLLKRYVFKVAEERSGQFFRDKKGQGDLNDHTPMETTELAHLMHRIKDVGVDLKDPQRKIDVVAELEKDFKGPISSIIAYSDLIRKRSDDSEIVESAHKIRIAAKHLDRLVNDLVDLSRIQAGKLRINEERVDIKLLVEEIVDSLRALIEKNHNDLFVHYEGSLGIILCDREKVYKIIKNLLSNAAKFTQNGLIDLTVRLETDRDIDLLVIEVKDTGQGMEPDQLRYIFRAFEQLRRRTIPGTGLGLPISRSLARFLGGDIVVESELGKGSRFLASIPVKAKEVS